MTDKIYCPRCGKSPKFWFHICRPTIEWIDSQIQDEVLSEIEKEEIINDKIKMYDR